MEARALIKNIPISPRKARLVADLVRSKYTNDALDILKYTHKAVTPVITKLIKSAIANAQYKDTSVDESGLYVKKILVDEGVTRKWIRPRARGMRDRILRRRCHITVILDEKVSANQ